MGSVADWFKKLDSHPWVKPALGAVASLAVLVKVVCPGYTVAGAAAEFFLTRIFPIVASASLGSSALPTAADQASGVTGTAGK